jgi:hypothetical protein
LTSGTPAHRVARSSAGRASRCATDNGPLLSITLGGDRRTCRTTHRAADHSTGISA